ncbi:acyltransferase, partial [Acidithiobacillus caldus]|nr:acyltransferase [Acidithiobacillus caldus]
PNVHLIRWDLLSKDHPDYYWSDRVHPNWLGIQVMVQAIAKALRKD